jgi:hypothetical protein
MASDAGMKSRYFYSMNHSISFRYDHVRPKAQVPSPVQPVSFPVNLPMSQNFPTPRLPLINGGGMMIKAMCK